MGLKTFTDFDGLTVAYRGQPFCFTSSKAQDTTTTSIAYRGQIFAYALAAPVGLFNAAIGNSAIGTLAPEVDPTVAQVSGTGTIGSVAPVVLPALAQVTGAAAIGAFGLAITSTLTLAQASGTAAIGALAIRIDGTLTLASATGAGVLGAVTKTIAPTFSATSGTGAASPFPVVLALPAATGTGLAGSPGLAVAALLGAAIGGGVASQTGLSKAETLPAAIGTGSVGTLGAKVDVAQTLAPATGAGATGSLGFAVVPNFAPATAASALGSFASRIDLIVASAIGAALIGPPVPTQARTLAGTTAGSAVGRVWPNILPAALGQGAVGALRLVINTNPTFHQVQGTGLIGALKVFQPRLVNRAHPAVVEYLPGNDVEHRAQIARTANLALAGQLNVTFVGFKLTPSATSTTFVDSRIGPTSILHFMPTTADAASAAASIYVSDLITGQATIHHASAVAADQIFNVSIISG